MLRRTRGRRGIALLEIVVALSVFSLALLAIFAAFKAAMVGWQVAQQVTSEQQGARALLDWLSRRVRLVGVGYIEAPGSPAINYGSDSEIRFWADADGNGTAECHQVYLRGGVVYDRTSTSSCTSGVERPLTSGLEAGRLEVTSLAFTYFDASTVGDPRLQVPLSDPNRYLVRRIEIAVGFRGLRPGQAPFAMSTQSVIRRER